jgi:hypothetical protein
MQRPLAMDWPRDAVARRVADQFMWGTALMVAPLVDGADDREVGHVGYDTVRQSVMSKAKQSMDQSQARIKKQSKAWTNHRL